MQLNPKILNENASKNKNNLCHQYYNRAFIMYDQSTSDILSMFKTQVPVWDSLTRSIKYTFIFHVFGIILIASTVKTRKTHILLSLSPRINFTSIEHDRCEIGR